MDLESKDVSEEYQRRTDKENLIKGEGRFVLTVESSQSHLSEGTGDGSERT